jgi:uncharacterized protein YegL
MITSRQPTSIRTLVVAALALLVSGASHFAVIEYLPVLPLKLRPVRPGAEEPSIPVRVDEVRLREPPKSFPELQKFIPTDPNRVADITQEVKSFDLLPDLSPLEQVVEPLTPLLGDAQATTAPQLAELQSDWEPRQEILAIQERLLRDEVAAIPRQLTPDVPRVARAPDVVEAGEAPAARDPGEALRLGPRAGADGFGAGLSPLAPSLAGRSLPATPAPPVPPPSAEIASLLDETMEEVTQVNAVENLLGLRTFLHRSPQEPGVGYFRLEIYRQGIEALPVLPKEFIFLVDCSESMTNAKLRECKEGVSRALDLLHPQDVFNIMFFRDTVWMAFEPAAAVSAVMRARARAILEPITARGRTDVFASLEKLSTFKPQPDRPVIAVLITDGRPTEGLLDSSDIIESFTRLNQGGRSVFSVGGGSRANKYLLDLLSYRNRGDALVIPQDRDIPAAVLKMSGELANPVLADLTYRFTGISESDIYPRRLTHLYLDRPLTIHGRVNLSPNPVAFQVVGRSGDKVHDLIFNLDLAQALPAGEDLRREWARHAVYQLIGEYIQGRDPATLGQIQDICNRHGIHVPYAYSLNSPVAP